MAHIEAPDLSTEEHRAIGLHFKRFPGRDHVWHNAERRWYRLAELETHVRIYDDRVKGWFLEAAKRLPFDGFLVLMIVAAYFEGNEQYRQGLTSKDKSKEFFCTSFNRIFPDLAPTKAADMFYREARCGLFHDGMTRSSVGISNQFTCAIEMKDGKLLLSPNRLLDVVISDHGRFVDELLDANNLAPRRNFKRLWDRRWSPTY